MTSSIRKPSGKDFIAYVACAHWLKPEFPDKFLAVKEWDHMKVLITKKPTPEKIGTIVIGVKDASDDAICTAVNEKGWSTTLYSKECTTENIMWITPVLLEAYKPIVSKRIDDHVALADAAGPRVARKRARFDDKEATKADDGTEALSVDNFTDDAKGSELHSPDDPAFSAPEDDVEDEPDVRPKALEWGEEADVKWMKDFEEKFHKQSEQIKALDSKVQLVSKVVGVMHEHGYQMDCVYMHNVAFDTSNPDKIKEKVKAMMIGLGLNKEAEDIKTIFLEGGGPVQRIKIMLKSC